MSSEAEIVKHINLPEEYKHQNDEVEKSQVELAVNSMLRQKNKVNLQRGMLNFVLKKAKQAEEEAEFEAQK